MTIPNLNSDSSANMNGWQEEFLESVSAHQWTELFQGVADVYFFVRAAEGGLVTWNAAFQAMFPTGKLPLEVGYESVFAPGFAAEFGAEEREMAKTREALGDRLWWSLFCFADRSGGWLVSSKIPLFSNEDGGLAGVAGVLRWLNSTESLTPLERQMGQLAQFMESAYPERITLSELAERVDLSERQLQRSYARVFRCSPSEHLMRIRIQAALRQMRGRASLAEISGRCGFADQSHFSNAFRKYFRVTPSEYRRGAGR